MTKTTRFMVYASFEI